MQEQVERESYRQRGSPVSGLAVLGIHSETDGRPVRGRLIILAGPNSRSNTAKKIPERRKTLGAYAVVAILPVVLQAFATTAKSAAVGNDDVRHQKT
jgi:hypothetical protein